MVRNFGKCKYCPCTVIQKNCELDRLLVCRWKSWFEFRMKLFLPSHYGICSFLKYWLNIPHFKHGVCPVNLKKIEWMTSLMVHSTPSFQIINELAMLHCHGHFCTHFFNFWLIVFQNFACLFYPTACHSHQTFPILL